MKRRKNQFREALDAKREALTRAANQPKPEQEPEPEPAPLPRRRVPHET
jgi:outer membrane protein TolC